LDGVFVEQYSPDKFGSGISLEVEDTDLLRYGSIYARMDGWDFSARMVQREIERKSIKN
jgi:hypothetical protein